MIAGVVVEPSFLLSAITCFYPSVGLVGPSYALSGSRHTGQCSSVGPVGEQQTGQGSTAHATESAARAQVGPAHAQATQQPKHACSCTRRPPMGSAAFD